MDLGSPKYVAVLCGSESPTIGKPYRMATEIQVQEGRGIYDEQPLEIDHRAKNHELH